MFKSKKYYKTTIENLESENSALREELQNKNNHIESLEKQLTQEHSMGVYHNVHTILHKHSHFIEKTTVKMGAELMGPIFITRLFLKGKIIDHLMDMSEALKELELVLPHFNIHASLNDFNKTETTIFLQPKEQI